MCYDTLSQKGGKVVAESVKAQIFCKPEKADEADFMDLTVRKSASFSVSVL